MELDLGEISVSVAPKHGTPGLVEGIERCILAAQPLLKPVPAEPAIATGAVPEREFVVDLPTDDARS